MNIINTGLKTQTGARIKKIKRYLKDEKLFFMTNGDGVANVNIKKILQYLQSRTQHQSIFDLVRDSLS